MPSLGTSLPPALRIPQRPLRASAHHAPGDPPPPFSICPEFWFADGNITIVAGGCGFRVHRGLLERHSEVFSDMFSFPSPDGIQDDRVTLYDAPADVYFFLKALYDGVAIERQFPTDFAFMAAILRLSRKYFVRTHRDQCLSLLARDYPRTLAEWDRREHSVTDPSGRYLPRDHIASPILVINLARELALDALLPAAFYDLSRYGPSKTAAGTSAPPALFLDAYVPAPSTDTSAPAVPVVVQDTGARASLAPDDLILLLAGREHGQSWLTHFLDRAVGSRSPAPTCAHARDGSRACRDSFFFLLLNTRRAVGGIAVGRDADPLFTLRQMGEMLHRTDFSDGARAYGLPMCCFCKADFVGAISHAREEAWRAIPAWFGLDRGATEVAEAEGGGRMDDGDVEM